jgi:exosortase A-associated hydrolase 2
MSETPFFFDCADYALFGILHEPAVVEAPAAPRPAFVFCHPFGEEKLWAHRVFVTFARALAQRGYPVLRFDFMGNGDSDGEFAESSLASAVADLSCAIDTVRRMTGCEEAALLGLRFGATVAALVADERPDVTTLIGWAPTVDGHRFMQEMLRVNLATQLAVHKEIREDRTALVAAMRSGRAVNVDGYPLSLAFYEQLSTVRLAKEPHAFTGRCLLAHIDRAEQGKPLPELEQLRAGYAHATLVTVQEEPFWKEIDRFYETAPNLFDATLAWLEGR